MLIASPLILVALVTFATTLNIPTNLENSLKVKGTTDIFLSLNPTRPILSQFKQKYFASRAEKKSAVANVLKEYSRQSQRSLLKFLAGKSDITVKSFWITNEIYIKNVSSVLVRELSRRTDLVAIREESKIPKVLPSVVRSSATHAQGELEWGVKKIEAKAVWDQGIDGTGIVVGILDSGVRVTHEALRDNFVGDYGWFAPIHESPRPEDWDGHGTHVMGIIAGRGGIGVAPGVKWMACKNVPGYEAEDIECGQFMLCPWLLDGSKSDCTKGADIVSNSWGRDQGGNFYFDRIIDAWEAANIVGIFAAGNGGPSCATIGSPADSRNPTAIIVGGTDSTDKLSAFSSFGPTDAGERTPDLVAPATDITSACVASDSNYCTMSGTSFAAPHTAGVVALMLSVNKTLSVREVAQYLYAGATHTVPKTGQNCGGINEGTYPNNHVGYGRLSAPASLPKFQ